MEDLLVRLSESQCEALELLTSHILVTIYAEGDYYAEEVTINTLVKRARAFIATIETGLTYVESLPTHYKGVCDA
jgi:hypothetical protein